ncbi:whirlin-like [Mytilus californianus]|uniref:whirlin-like n=1 Tax=Mytilus californianus TaxID=6549 RepID=UPI002246FDE5|nr:whirlin-like [Mytilus californianus]
MDSCLDLTPIKIPRPQIYSVVDLAIMNSKKELEIKLKDLKKKYLDVHVEIVTIYRTKPTFGVAVQGGADTQQKTPIVVHIQPGGSAFASGTLKCGHEIFEINGTSTERLTHDEIANLIASEFKTATNIQPMELVVKSFVTCL